MSRAGKSTETESRSVVARWPRDREWLLIGTGFPLWMIENILELEAVVGQHGECNKCPWFAYFKRVNFILCKFISIKKKKGKKKQLFIAQMVEGGSWGRASRTWGPGLFSPPYPYILAGWFQASHSFSGYFSALICRWMNSGTYHRGKIIITQYTWKA